MDESGMGEGLTKASRPRETERRLGEEGETGEPDLSVSGMVEG